MCRISYLLLTGMLLFLAGCVGSDVPVEDQLKERVSKITELKDIKLKEANDRTWSGSGMSEQGFVWSIKLKPDPNYKKKFNLSWTKGKSTYHSCVYVN